MCGLDGVFGRSIDYGVAKRSLALWPEGAGPLRLMGRKVSSRILRASSKHDIHMHTRAHARPTVLIACAGVTVHSAQCTAVSLITRVSRAKTSLAYCLIIWTSPEINFDVEFLWVSCLGPRQGGWGVEVAGQLRMWAKCVRHMQRYEREHERGGVGVREVARSLPHIFN